MIGGAGFLVSSPAAVAAIIAFASWDALAHNGKYRHAVSSMAGHIVAAYHVR